jgi:60 kDa SS-A/Ro ribonucleoprotein
MKNYLKNVVNKQHTPQTQPIPGKNMTANSAGGYTFAVDQWERMKRFLILGSEGGSYYASEQTLTAENAKNVIKCIEADGKRTVAIIVAISDGGRAPKNDPAIFALALAAAYGDDATRKIALNALPQVCRIGTHLFTFVEYIKGMRGWGRGLRRAIGTWYASMDERQLAYQLVKYRQRNGWTHIDTLRKAHPMPISTTQGEIYKWVTKRDEVAWKSEPTQPENDAMAFIWAFERVQEAADVNTVLNLIQTYDLPREALPTQWLNNAAVWEALLAKMPMTAMIRNLGNMSKSGLLVAGSDAEKHIVKALTDAKLLRKARVHPIAVLSALRVYAGGTALKGGNRYGNAAYYNPPQNQDWTPVAKVIDALDTAFELAFQSIEPTNKSTMLALDVSGSMGMGTIAGVPGLNPREGSAAMAMVTARTEPNYMFTAFSHQMVPLNISAKMRLDDVIKTVSGLNFGMTDCALPMVYAMEKKLKIETFMVFTDSETYFNKSLHPIQALHDYRQKMGIAAKLIVVGMISNGFTIADPEDGGCLDVVGFDTSAPAVMADFARGTI